MSILVTSYDKIMFKKLLTSRQSPPKKISISFDKFKLTILFQYVVDNLDLIFWHNLSYSLKAFQNIFFTIQSNISCVKYAHVSKTLMTPLSYRVITIFQLQIFKNKHMYQQNIIILIQDYHHPFSLQYHTTMFCTSKAWVQIYYVMYPVHHSDSHN